MNDKVFADTNILIYSVSDDLRKRAVADALLLNRNIVISTQVISEFIAVTLRKKILEREKVIEYAEKFMQVFEIALITDTTIKSALNVMVAYHISYWDSLILAAALESSCTTVFSEDLQDGQRIEGNLMIVNPFKLL
jgi:predicted nucleic acid-binding protein